MKHAFQITFVQFVGIGLLGLCSVANVQAADNSDRTFQNWAKFFHGGVWRTTAGGRQHEHRYEKIYDDRLQVGETIDAGVRARLVIAVDPSDGNCRFWQFRSDGCVTIFKLQEVDGDTWDLTGTGNGPKGETKYRSRVTRTGPNSTKEELLEYVLNGVEQPTTVRNWRRSQE